MAIRKLEMEFKPAPGQDPEAFDKWIRYNQIVNVLLVGRNGSVFMMNPGRVEQEAPLAPPDLPPGSMKQ